MIDSGHIGSPERCDSVWTRVAEWLVPAGLVYFTLIGGTGPGELQPILRLVNSAVGVGLIVLWMRAAPGRSDALDRSVLAGLLLYLVSGVLARAPHAAFEAAMTTTAYAALFFALRTETSNPVTRTRTAQWLGLTGVVLAVAYSALWLAVWSRWLAADQPGWALFYVPLPSGPYGFKHNVALVAGLLIPFLWIASSGVSGRVQRAIGVAVIVPVLIIAGSRALWVGAVLATTAVLIRRALSRRRVPDPNAPPWWPIAVAGIVAVAAIVSLAPELARAIAVRVGNLLTLSARWDLWAASLVEWRTSLLTGVGPGGWPIWLPTTGYFDVAAFSPRHPDNLLFQLLAEVGVVGVAAVGVVAAGIWRSLRIALPAPTLWAAVFLLVACITANPTDLPFAVVLGVVWLSVTVPRLAPAPPPPLRRGMGGARSALLGVIVLVVGMSSAAGILHERAGQFASAGDAMSARRALEVAIALDPDLALYRREQGALLLAAGDRSGSLAALSQAALLNPADDITMAELAVVLSLDGRHAEGITAAARAVDLRRSALINHLVLAWVAARGGQATTAADALADSLVLAPWLAAAEGWQVLLGENLPGRILKTAAIRATTDPIGRVTGNAGWLAGMTGQNEILNTAAVKLLKRDRVSLGAVIAVLACDISRAEQIVADAEATERAAFTYWLVRAMVERAGGHSSSESLNLASVLEPASLLTSDVPASASAFGARADDQWVYDRIPIRLQDVGPVFPSEEAGSHQWITDPRHAAAVAAPNSGLAHCSE